MTATTAPVTPPPCAATPGDEGRVVDLRAEALRYAEAGLQVLPLHSMMDSQRCTCRGKRACPSPAKHPRILDGLTGATSDPEQVARWWDILPDANIGLRVPRGFIVLDVDPRNGGDKTLFRLMREHGELPQTLMAGTGGGGVHIWLAYGGKSRGKLGPGLDVKTNTGYVVAPPSLHSSGRRYQWIDNGHLSARCPDWLRPLLDPPPVPVPIDLDAARTQRSSLTALVRFVSESKEGERNNSLYWASCRAHESGLPTDALVDAAVAVGLPRWWAHNTAASGAKAAPRRGGRRG